MVVTPSLGMVEMIGSIGGSYADYSRMSSETMPDG
jgi:hypothetical protein